MDEHIFEKWKHQPVFKGLELAPVLMQTTLWEVAVADGILTAALESKSWAPTNRQNLSRNLQKYPLRLSESKIKACYLDNTQVSHHLFAFASSCLSHNWGLLGLHRGYILGMSECTMGYVYIYIYKSIYIYIIYFGIYTMGYILWVNHQNSPSPMVVWPLISNGSPWSPGINSSMDTASAWPSGRSWLRRQNLTGRCQMVPGLCNFAHRIRRFWSIQSFLRYLGAEIFTTLAAKVPSLQFLTGGWWGHVRTVPTNKHWLALEDMAQSLKGKFESSVS